MRKRAPIQQATCTKDRGHAEEDPSHEHATARNTPTTYSLQHGSASPPTNSSSRQQRGAAGNKRSQAGGPSASNSCTLQSMLNGRHQRFRRRVLQQANLGVAILSHFLRHWTLHCCCDRCLAVASTTAPCNGLAQHSGTLLLHGPIHVAALGSAAVEEPHSSLPLPRLSFAPSRQ